MGWRARLGLTYTPFQHAGTGLTLAIGPCLGSYGGPGGGGAVSYERGTPAGLTLFTLEELSKYGTDNPKVPPPPDPSRGECFL